MKRKFLLLAGITVIMTASAFVSCKFNSDDDDKKYLGYASSKDNCSSAAAKKGYKYYCLNSSGSCYGMNSKGSC